MKHKVEGSSVNNSDFSLHPSKTFNQTLKKLDLKFRELFEKWQKRLKNICDHCHSPDVVQHKHLTLDRAGLKMT